MKSFKHLVLAALVVLTALPAMADFKIGPRVGINVNSLHFNSDLFEKDNRAGINAGLQAEFTVPIINIGMDASVMYVRRSSEWMRSNATAAVENKLHNDYIEVPINLKYKFAFIGVGNIVAPYIFTGPSFSFLTSKQIVNDFKSRKTDVAWNFGLGVELVKHLQIGASYGLGLNKALNFVGQDVQGAGIQAKNRYWTVTAAWLF